MWFLSRYDIIKYTIVGESSKMNDKFENKYLSVGALSKLTGVHIKSLRYYDAIGALKPAYVNPETGYRYYTHEQLHLLEAIRLCIELDIPLAEFSEFIDGDGRLRFGNLIETGRERAVSKIRAIKENLDYLEDIKRVINRAEAYSNGHKSLTFSSKRQYFWVEPYDGEQSYKGRYAKFLHLMDDIVSRGLKLRYEMGVLFIEGGGRSERYYYNELNITDEAAARFPQVLCVPERTQTGIMLNYSDIENAARYFPERFATDDVKYIFETELSTGNYDYSVVLYELRVG